MLIGHLLACLGVILLMSGGRSLFSLPGIGYRALPIALAILFVVTIATPKRWRLDCVALALLLGLWLGAGITSLFLFPVSGFRLAAVSTAAATVIAIGIIGAAQGIERRTAALLAMLVVIGGGFAMVPVWLMKSPPASTKPQSISFAPITAGDVERRTLRLDTNVALDTAQATVTVNAGRRFVYIEPVLTFIQRSPDACWTIFASRAHRQPPLRALVRTANDSENVCAEYLDSDGDSIVAESRVDLRRGNGEVSIESQIDLKQVVWSHLNAFTQVTVAGHKSLSVSFSPSPNVRIALKNADYPAGEPSQLAYLDRGGILHVVRAQSAEKGPFTELASGRLDGPLSMTFYDGAEAFMMLRFEDWAVQASVDPSPTAGWGVPQNAIEFSLLSENARSPASIFISLAGTSVGRGWNSVGHVPGVYRNRMSIAIPEAAR